MFRRFTAFILIVTVLSANFSRYFVYAGFEFNKNYIATNLCENRNKPVMQCNGKCYLAKKLKQEAEKEKNQERESKKSVLQDAFFAEKVAFNLQPLILKSVKVKELSFALPRHASLVFHPPQV
jgi:hypothetical protein